MRNTRTFIPKILAALVLAMLMIAGATSATFAAGNTVTVEVSGTYGQTEARTMLQMVNDFRTGVYIDGNQSSVWAKAENGSIDTASYANLGTLQYDYELEKVAMQRAMEIALQFDHERPNTVPNSNEKSWTTLYPEGYTARGENLATGYGGNNSTAEKTFQGWCETNYGYKGQGHRRNMLGREYNRIGVAHVVIHWSGNVTDGEISYPYETDIHYWVQEFGYRTDSFGLTSTTANNSNATVSADVLKSNIEYTGIETDADSLEMNFGESVEFNGASTAIRLSEMWPESFRLQFTSGGVTRILTAPYRLSVGAGYSISIANQSIASVSGKTITAKKAGTTTVTITSDLDSTASKTVELTVKPVSISNATVTFSGSYQYDGKKKEPTPTVKLNGKTLVQNTDYTVEYDKNINAGNATVLIRGINNYNGTCSGGFTIAPLTLTANMFSVDDSGLIYNGSAQVPTVSGHYGDLSLTENTDYKITCNNAVSAGSHTLSVEGINNCTGNFTLGFNIQKADKPAVMPSTGYQVPYTTNKLQNSILSDAVGWSFDDDDLDTPLTEGQTASFTAYYTGADAGNYNTETVSVNVTRLECDHPEASREVRGKVNAGCETKGYTGDIYCTVCGRLVEKGSDINATGHSYGAWITETPATCTAEGSEYRVCANNSFHKEYRPIEKIKHNLAHTAAVDPDCETAGNIEYWQCSMCKQYFSDESAANTISYDDTVIPAKTHKWGDWELDYPSTCVKKGREVRVCSNNTEHKEYRDIDQLAQHTLTQVDATEAKCETAGNIGYWHCSVCNKYFDSEDATHAISKNDTVITPTGHVWSEWVTVAEPADGQDGTAERFCSTCGKKETKTIPYVPESTGDDTKPQTGDNHDPASVTGEDGTALGKGASIEAAEAAITGMKSDKDPKGAAFSLLQLRMYKQAKTSVTIKWKKVPGAAKYVIYGNKCGLKNHMTRQLETTGLKRKFTSVKGNSGKSAKVKKGTYYKFIVVALDGNNKVISTSKVIHVATKGGKVGNDKSVTVKKSVLTKAKALKKGSQLRLNAKAVPQSSKLIVKRHRKVSYESTDPKIARVNSKGVVKALKKGQCYIYAYAQDGVMKKIKVVVK